MWKTGLLYSPEALIKDHKPADAETLDFSRESFICGEKSFDFSGESNFPPESITWTITK